MILQKKKTQGFTLIELSIVLVIIGLIVGGVLVGRDLMAAAAVRAQISQMDAIQQATNTFRAKYGYLPGDIREPEASQFGFVARGAYAGQGDGNGIIQGVSTNSAGNNSGMKVTGGEPVMVWVDLSYAKLIPGSFTAASPLQQAPTNYCLNSSCYGSYYPPATIGGNNYIYVWNGGQSGDVAALSDKVNYFGMMNVMAISGYALNGMPGLTVKQAYSIDAKIDDGLPQSGRTLALWAPISFALWADYNTGPPTNPATSASNSTCFDNGGNAGQPMQYSIGYQNGTAVMCVLSFKFQ